VHGINTITVTFTGSFRDVWIVVRPEQIQRHFTWTLRGYQGAFPFYQSHDAKRKKVVIDLRLQENVYINEALY